MTAVIEAGHLQNHDQANQCWIVARIITTLLDASDVMPQPPPSTTLSRHASGCRQGVTVEAPGQMRRDVGSDLVFPLFWVCWEDNGSHQGALAIEGVLADGSRHATSNIHGQIIEDCSIVSASQQWAVSCSSGGSHPCICDCVGSPQGFDGGSSSGRPLVSLCKCLHYASMFHFVYATSCLSFVNAMQVSIVSSGFQAGLPQNALFVFLFCSHLYYVCFSLPCLCDSCLLVWF